MLPLTVIPDASIVPTTDKLPAMFALVPTDNPPVVVIAPAVMLPPIVKPDALIVPVVVIPALLTLKPPVPISMLPVPVVLKVPAVMLCATVKLPPKLRLVVFNVLTDKLPIDAVPILADVAVMPAALTVPVTERSPPIDAPVPTDKPPDVVSAAA